MKETDKHRKQVAYPLNRIGSHQILRAPIFRGLRKVAAGGPLFAAFGQWSLTNARGSGRFPRYTRIFDILVDIGVPAEKEVIQ